MELFQQWKILSLEQIHEVLHTVFRKVPFSFTGKWQMNLLHSIATVKNNCLKPLPVVVMETVEKTQKQHIYFTRPKKTLFSSRNNHLMTAGPPPHLSQTMKLYMFCTYILPVVKILPTKI